MLPAISCTTTKIEYVHDLPDLREAVFPEVNDDELEGEDVVFYFRGKKCVVSLDWYCELMDYKNIVDANFEVLKGLKNDIK